MLAYDAIDLDIDLELFVGNFGSNEGTRELSRRFIRSTSMIRCPRVKWNARSVKLGSKILNHKSRINEIR